MNQPQDPAESQASNNQSSHRKTVAIIGSGIAGMTCAHLLKDQFKVDLYESENRLGGHTHTVDVDVKGQTYAIDTGFIVFNDRTYPNFEKLMRRCGVEWQDTEMSFSVSNRENGLEYNGHNLDTLFAQRRNLLSPTFYGFVGEILRFNKAAKAYKNSQQSQLTLGQFIDNEGFSAYFQKHYLLPMVSAIWSCSLDDARQFPLSFFLQFFLNHGLLEVKDRPQWRVICGGSSNYIPKLTAGLEDSILLNRPVDYIVRNEAGHKTPGVEVWSQNQCQHYDHVILACHSDQALKLLANPSNDEQDILGKMEYQPNQVTLHTDSSRMPENRKAWASWNVRIGEYSDDNSRPTQVTYYMNRLQGLDANCPDFFVSLNQDETIDPASVLRTFVYHHPVISEASHQAQQQWQQISGVDNTHFCGAYWRNGFHEDGVFSALRVCESLGVSL
ncbi:MAG: FAD-dependent oxidoreductase [Candidatus Pelagadaptatus aseana]|uniref:NAD(P)/FAD-dependent oxidoreductase n=1 Tax=Candidatus Pelagadaptatus aseana TaxID=3120508 RepID=UPI0039B24411